jgi:hypothetical protein
MTEPNFEDRVFEERVATALRRYADGAPTAVNARALAHGLATSHPRRVGLAAFGSWSRPALQLAWLLLLVALLAVLLVGLAIIGHPAPVGVDRIVVTGSATCADSAPGVASPAGELTRVDGIVTDCAVALSDPRVSGPERRTESRYAEQDGSASGTATSELQASSGLWSGKVATRLYPNGIRIVEGTYEGGGEDSGLELLLRGVSADGRRWSLTGSIERRP